MDPFIIGAKAAETFRLLSRMVSVEVRRGRIAFKVTDWCPSNQAREMDREEGLRKRVVYDQSGWETRIPERRRMGRWGVHR